MVDSGKILNKANTTADIMVQKAVQEITEGAKADTVLARAERLQMLTRANTTLAVSTSCLKFVSLFEEHRH